MLGEVFGGNGVVVAPAQKQEREHWDEVTAALVVPSPKSAEDTVTVDQLIEQAVSSCPRERAKLRDSAATAAQGRWQTRANVEAALR